MERQKKSKHFLHQPEYTGGPKAMTEFIYKNLRYPQSALDAGTEGVVLTEIEIDQKGNVLGARVLTGLGNGCDEEAVRVVKLLKFDVAKNRGVRVTFFKKIKVQFKKPKVQVAPPQAQLQVQYTMTPAEPKKEEEKPANTFSYTITLK